MLYGLDHQAGELAGDTQGRFIIAIM